MQCTRVTDSESCERQCPKEAVYKGMCRGCAWVELPEEREMLPAKVKIKRSASVAKKPKRKRDEADLQVLVCKYLKTLPNTLYWHCPSSFYRGANSGPGFFGYIARLKAMGWYAGIPDLCVCFQNRVRQNVTVFLELKTPAGKQTDAQHLFMSKARDIGCPAGFVRSLEDVIQILARADHPSIPFSKS